MTRKHFQEWAKTTAEILAFPFSGCEADHIRWSIEATLKESNPRFDSKRWNAAVDKHLEEVKSAS